MTGCTSGLIHTIEPTSTGYVILGVVYAENGRERLEANLYCESELPGLAEIKGELAKFYSDSDAEKLCNEVSCRQARTPHRRGRRAG